ncbi:hypothetical protein NECAME_09845 [Necator americanus]|uniref:Secreted protein n=1 Tax=Necator americanus TaxID=51031 RepID=W2TEI5_NECAM|nr:hypothetical protein NECAME_09845 [Necator americanus]ETN79407.1 hypothetical protein NECAME_09845 [Necator americanus]
MLRLVVGAALLAATGVMAQVRCLPEQDYANSALESAGNGLQEDGEMVQELKRTIDLNDMISNCTQLRHRVEGNPIADVISELVLRLQKISPADVEMLADGHRAQDNELVDEVLVANNIINKMIDATDEELRREPPNLGALILASNNIEEYVRTHQRIMLDEDRQF